MLCAIFQFNAASAIMLRQDFDYFLPILDLPAQLCVTGSEPSPITGITNDTRAYTLTGLTNYTWYTVTLSAVLDSTQILTDTMTVMPTDLLVYLPLALKER